MDKTIGRHLLIIELIVLLNGHKFPQKPLVEMFIIHILDEFLFLYFNHRMKECDLCGLKTQEHCLNFKDSSVRKASPLIVLSILALLPT